MPPALKNSIARALVSITVYLSDTHDYAHLDVVRQATRLDGNKQEIESKVKGKSQTSVNMRNTKLDSFTG